jgi:hypothetical protein
MGQFRFQSSERKRERKRERERERERKMEREREREREREKEREGLRERERVCSDIHQLHITRRHRTYKKLGEIVCERQPQMHGAT